MGDLSTRQLKIIQAIVEEYVATGIAVGSETIEKKYKLGVSPATVRNEMVKLIEMGYLKQPHTSAGRIPTTTALRLYIQEIMKEKQMSVRDEVHIKQQLWDERHDYERLMRNATLVLADTTNLLGVAITGDDDIFYAGAAHILDIPEFFDIDVTKTVLSLLDRHELLLNVFKRATTTDPVKVLLGEELDMHYLEPCGFVFTGFYAGRYGTGMVGIIGPSRLNYPYVVPIVRYFGSLISEVGRNW
jgi:heat-inducible transcriptional repressor